MDGAHLHPTPASAPPSAAERRAEELLSLGPDELVRHLRVARRDAMLRAATRPRLRPA